MSGDDRVVCVACGAIDGVPFDRPASTARCGGCGEPLFAGKPADVNGQVFDRLIGGGLCR